MKISLLALLLSVQVQAAPPVARRSFLKGSVFAWLTGGTAKVLPAVDSGPSEVERLRTAQLIESSRGRDAQIWSFEHLRAQDWAVQWMRQNPEVAANHAADLEELRRFGREHGDDPATHESDWNRIEAAYTRLNEAIEAHQHPGFSRVFEADSIRRAMIPELAQSLARLERDLALHRQLSIEEIHAALRLTLDPYQWTERIFRSLDGPTPGEFANYDDEFVAEVVTALVDIAPLYAQHVRRQQFDDQTALDFVWANVHLRRFLEGDRKYSRFLSSPRHEWRELRQPDLLRVRLERAAWDGGDILAKLVDVRRRFETLPVSTLRTKTLAAIDAVARDVAIDVRDLPLSAARMMADSPHPTSTESFVPMVEWGRMLAQILPSAKIDLATFARHAGLLVMKECNGALAPVKDTDTTEPLAIEHHESLTLVPMEETAVPIEVDRLIPAEADVR